MKKLTSQQREELEAKNKAFLEANPHYYDIDDEDDEFFDEPGYDLDSHLHYIRSGKEKKNFGC